MLQYPRQLMNANHFSSSWRTITKHPDKMHWKLPARAKIITGCLVLCSAAAQLVMTSVRKSMHAIIAMHASRQAGRKQKKNAQFVTFFTRISLQFALLHAINLNPVIPMIYYTFLWKNYLVASKSKRAWKFQCIFGSPQQMAGPSRESKAVLTCKLYC